jgi:hypothetical protein
MTIQALKEYLALQQGGMEVIIGGKTLHFHDFRFVPVSGTALDLCPEAVILEDNQVVVTDNT